MTSGAASADPPKAQDPAITYFEESSVAYRKGDFARAIELLNKAYALRPSPVLLYNLARAYEGSGRLEEAVTSYREYIAKEPNAADRGAIEKRIETIVGQIDERKRLERERAEAARPRTERRDRDYTAPEEPPPKRSPVPWIVVGGGAVVLAGGGVLRVVAGSNNDDAQKQSIQTKSDAMGEDARSLATISTVTMIAGGAILAAGLVWAIATPAPKRNVAALTRRPLELTW